MPKERRAGNNINDNCDEAACAIYIYSCFNPRTNKLLSMSISVPQLVSVGKYELSGQALVPLEQSSGTYKTTFQDVLLNGESKIKVQFIVLGIGGSVNS